MNIQGNIKGKILTIAGSDPSGGAGIQADIKTITALGGYAMAVITALTVQNSLKVYDVHMVAPTIVTAQITRVLEDIVPDAIKVGMMGNAEITEHLAQIFMDNSDIPLIIDPVILSTSNHPLLEEKAIDILRTDIFPLIDLLTPNLAEAACLAKCEAVETIDDMRRVGDLLRGLGPKAVLVKGGHLSGGVVTDILVSDEGVFEISSPYIPTNNTHGTGCTLSAAIATSIGQGLDLKTAFSRAHKYVHDAILHAPDFGQGNGPLNHLVALDLSADSR